MPTPAEMAPPAAAPPAAAPPAARPAPPPAAEPAATDPAAVPPPKPRCARPSFLKKISGPMGQHGGQRLARGLELAAEGAAALAVLQVAAGRGGGADQALGHLGQLDPHLLAGEQARLGGLGQADAGADQQRLDAGHRGVHGLGDLVVGQRVDLAQQQRRLLGLRQLLDVGHDLAELLAPVHRLGRAGAVLVLEDVHRVLAGGARAAQVVQAAVARDAVQPGARVDGALVGQQGVERGGEDLLQHVLRVLLRAQHVAAEGQQPRLVALHQRVEGAVVPAPDHGHELLVALQPEQG